MSGRIEGGDLAKQVWRVLGPNKFGRYKKARSLLLGSGHS